MGSTHSVLRLFIAISVPPEVRKEIENARNELRRHSQPDAIRWTRSEQFHLTLTFLGDVPADQVESLEKAVSDVCAGYPAMQLAAHGIGFFPSARKPRVVWVGIGDPGGQLAGLHRLFDPAVRPFTPEWEEEKFSGHITLGRFGQGQHRVEDFLKQAELRERHFGNWTAGSVEIVRSDVTSSGAIHTVLKSCPLCV